MTYHPGKVIKRISHNDEGVRSSDQSVQALLEMWDGNVFTFLVEDGLEEEIKENSVVLVDYRPTAEGNIPIARQKIVKVLEGKLAEDVWDRYSDFKDTQQKRSIPPTNPIQPSYMG